MQELIQNSQCLLHSLLLADFFGKLHNLKCVLLLAVFKNALVDWIVHTHASHADKADNDAQHEAAGCSTADLPHGEAHSRAENKCGNNSDGVSAVSYTHLTVIQIDRLGQNCILLYAGANGAITTDFMQRVISGFSAGDVLVLQNEINLTEDIINAAVKKGMQIALNPSPMTPALLKCSLEKVTWFLLNEGKVSR